MNGPCERPLTLDDVRSFNFPVGEMHIQLPENILTRNFVDITYEYSGNESVIKFMMIGDTLKRLGISIRTIYIPYLPFSREDRAFEKGGSFGLAFFADIVNRMEPNKVIVTDAHSDIALDLIRNSHNIEQHTVFVDHFRKKNDFVLVAPDKGALPKIKKLADCVDEIGVLTFDKERELSTGKIIRHVANDWKEEYRGKDFYIVDDICDGGATFVSIGLALRKLNNGEGRNILMVTHGFFTKTLSVFDGTIDEIYTSKGRVK